jgi:UDP-glucose 4-epimerase
LSQDANSVLYSLLKKKELLEYKTTIKKLSNLYKNRLIYFSSASIYSDKHRRNIKENYKIHSNSLYSKNKIECEKFVKRNNGIILRLTNIVGKNMPDRNIITRVLKQIKKKKIIIQNKFPVRDFLHVDDLFKLILKIIKKPQSGIYNVGSGNGIKIYDLVKAILKSKSKKKKIISIEKKFKFSRKVLDIKKVSKNFDWRPNIKILTEVKSIL